MACALHTAILAERARETPDFYTLQEHELHSSRPSPAQRAQHPRLPRGLLPPGRGPRPAPWGKLALGRGDLRPNPMDAPLNIGMVCYPTHGGSGAVAAELGRWLARRGHTIHFISYSRPVRLLQDFHENIRHHEIDTIPYPLFLGPLYGISASVRIYDIIRSARLDLLHVHYALPHAVCAFLANEMLEPAERVPVMTTLHGTDITLIGNTPAFRPAVKLGLDKSDVLTCVSHWLADRTCEYFDICERLNVIYNFIDASLYVPRQGPIPRSRFAKEGEALLLHVSNFRPVKRVQDVIGAFARIARRLPAQLLLVGEGPERPGAVGLARELGVAERVTCVGEQQDVRPFLALADLLLLPSAAESFGLAAAEALASEVPVIGVRNGGLPEVVQDGEHGFLLDLGDVEAMAAAALSLLENPERRRAMGEAGRRRVMERFAPERIVPQYENFYGAMLRSAAAVPS